MSGGLATVWARELLRGFALAGVERAIVCPGSRSTPLALAALEVFGDAVSVVVDERSAAFVALGSARVSGAPCLMIVTSGSAGAHALPAIIEAEQADIPFLIVTADRPLELFEAGAPQTIDQNRLFGSHVRAFFELGAPDELALPRLAQISFRAVRASLGPRSGPVHVNARFRKPLEPLPEPGPTFEPAPRCELVLGELAPSERALGYVQRALAEAQRPVVVVGPLPFSARPRSAREADLSNALLALTRCAGLAVLSEVTSGVSAAPDAPVLGLAPLLESGALSGRDAPDLIVELGSPPVASSYAKVALSCPRRVVVSPSGAPDPFGNAVALIEAEPLRFISDLGARLASAALPRRPFAERLVRVAGALSATLSRCFSDEAPEIGEPHAMWALAGVLPSGAVLALGNSLVVRDFDTFGAVRLPRAVSVLHQRGASGIDGLIAGAVGARLAAASGVPVALALGDVSALHDVGSLALLRDIHTPLVLVVVNNGGGRIFDELPVQRALTDAGAFEKLFLTPPGPFLEQAARAFGVAYRRVGARSELEATLAGALTANVATVVEVMTSHEAGKRVRAQIGAALRAAASEVLGDG